MPRFRALAASALLLTAVACATAGNGTDSSNPPNALPDWQPIDRTALPASCGAPLDHAPPPPRASSLRRASCDFGETNDFIQYDLNCAPGTSCGGQQTGDQLCHRVCDDGKCAGGETCEKRTIYVSDTLSHQTHLCMCSGGACSEKPIGPHPAEGGIDVWRDEPRMPVDVYYHAAAASDRQLFVSGGLRVKERSPNGSASLEPLTTVYVADLDVSGSVANWRQAGALAIPTINHGMAIVGDRLYVAGGEILDGTARGFDDAVVSYSIAADGSLGSRRDESKLPHVRGWHVLLVDASAPVTRLVVASGGTDSHYFTDGTKEIAFASVGAADGVVGSWSTVDAPAALYHDRAAGISAGSLYAFVSGEYGDRSGRALYGIRLADLGPGAPATKFVRNAAWPYDPAALDSVNEHVRLEGSCDALVFVGASGAIATAAVDAAAHVGAFRAAARFEGTPSGSAVTSSPSGRIYVTGGNAGTSEQGAAVRSTRRLYR